jgi:hypothetical protein
VKKGIIYTLIAAVLGLALVLIPLITIRVENENDGDFSRLFPEQLQPAEVGSYNTDAASSWHNELSFLAISFALALTVFLVVRRRVPQRGTA